MANTSRAVNTEQSKRLLILNPSPKVSRIIVRMIRRRKSMKHAIRILCGLLLVTLLTSANIWAQATAQISGLVHDQTGAVLPGVEITATQTATGVVRTGLTNEAGAYTLSNLATGPYRIEVSL